MSTSICCYEGCKVRRLPCTSIVFFSIPTDTRREQWIINSGNKDLKNLRPTSTRFFCENHFHASDIRPQFNRKTLRRNAVPIPYHSSSSCETQNTSIEKCSTSKSMEYFTDDSNYCNKIEILQSQNQSDKSNLSVEVLAQYEPIEENRPETNTESEKSSNTNDTVDVDDIFKDELEEFSVADNMEQQGVMCTMQSSINQYEEIADTDRCWSDETIGHNRSTFSDDRHFALSLVGYFQRLSHEKKAIAKLKILSYLTALGLNNEADL